MPLSIGNATISGGSNFSVRNAAGNTIYQLAVNAYGGQNYSYWSESQRPMFVAGGSNANWVQLTQGQWQSVSTQLNTTVVNNNNCYNSTIGRFTAAVSGLYLFHQQHYMYQNDNNQTCFAVNGSITARRRDVIDRITGYGYAPNFQTDNTCSEVIPLIAGDYVEPYIYAGTNSYIYPAYGLFTGVFVG